MDPMVQLFDIVNGKNQSVPRYRDGSARGVDEGR
jgi:hypothetical protein